MHLYAHMKRTTDLMWLLCLAARIQTLSLMRNRIDGSLDNLKHFVSLGNLMLSGNYLSCQTPKLDNLLLLGEYGG